MWRLVNQRVVSNMEAPQNIRASTSGRKSPLLTPRLRIRSDQLYKRCSYGAEAILVVRPMLMEAKALLCE